MDINNDAAVKLNKLLLEKNACSVLSQHMPFICELIPEIKDMIGFEQNNPHHYLDVWKHTLVAIDNSPVDIILRLTMLFHDIAKPRCYTEDERGGHFYGHPQISSDMAREILLRLGYDNGTIEMVTQLVLYHDAEIQPRRKHLKRWLNKIGEDKLRLLLKIKRADAIAQSELYRQSKLSALDSISPIIDDIVAQQKCFTLKEELSKETINQEQATQKKV